MTTFATRTNKDQKKAANYFVKMNSELDLEKYKLDKYQQLFELSSFQAMHDADLAYHHIYTKCADGAHSKESVLDCLAQEELYLTAHPNAFNADNYRQHSLKAISEIRLHIKSGSLDHLF
ncbi:MAG TPA: hypothetical protein VGM63_05550 [Mucilaginibacter sp.]